MGTNSIRSNLNKEDIIATIKLTLSADLKKQKIVVVVEGEDDIIFLKSKFQPNVDIYESYSGKCGVKEIVTHFSDNRVIGICDRDYDQQGWCPQLFCYDFSCLEMMLISNDVVFAQLCNTYYDGELVSNEVRFKLLSDLIWLSCCRKVSAKKGWNIRFNGISIQKAFNRETKKLDISDLISQLSKSNSGFKEDQERLQVINIECDKDYLIEEYFFITQGHDFLHYFHVFCISLYHTKQRLPGVNELFRSLVCAYRKEDFMNSTLYRELSEYENRHKLTILLKEL